jgi:NAD(P)-dependent dehydrogenase (short-subunit alcohol dehydrogenase family)
VTLPSQRLDGRGALVTGAGRGLGRACALALSGLGAHVTLMARSRDELEAVAAACPGPATVVAGDVTDAAAVERAVAAADAGGALAVSVHCAGINRPGPTLELDQADFDAVIDVNVRATFLVARAAGARMVARGHGSIVHLSSQMGSVGYPGRAAYCASKHAVDGLTKALAVEWAPHGVRVNAVAPTFVRTPLTAPMLADPAFREDVERRIPAGRVGEVEEVVGAVAFLASDQSTLVNGHVLAVDGGWTAW